MPAHRRNCSPVEIAGRRFWMATANMHSSGVPQIWIHTNPYRDAVYYTAGTVYHDKAAIEEMVERVDPILSPKAASLWEKDAAECSSWDAYHKAEAEETREELEALLQAERRELAAEY